MLKPDKHLYEFGPFRLDISERVLLRDGEVVPLTPKAVDLLVATGRKQRPCPEQRRVDEAGLARQLCRRG